MNTLLWHGIDTIKTGYYIGPNQIFEQIAHIKIGTATGTLAVPKISGKAREHYIVNNSKHKYKHAIRSEDQILLFRRRKDDDRDNAPQVMVECGPEAVAAHGLTENHERTLTTLADLEAEHYTERVSEVHLTCDIEHQLQYSDLWNQGIDGKQAKFTTRTRKQKAIEAADEDKITEIWNSSRYETFTFGSGNLIRIYDKTRELKARPHKQWERQLWKNPNATNVTRVEFQLRREMLKELGINTIDDLKRNIPGIWKYLTTKWFRINNSEFWHAVQQAQPDDQPKPRVKPNKSGCLQAARSQLTGQLQRVMLLTQDDPLTQGNPWHILDHQINSHVNARGETFWKGYTRKLDYENTTRWREHENSGGDVIQVPPDRRAADGGFAGAPPRRSAGPHAYGGPP